MKKVPLRTCAITKEKLEKKDLFRIVRTPEGNVVYDETGKVNGKGAYLKKDKEVILKAIKSKSLDRLLEVEVPEELLNSLIEKI
jgi:hypothetical protein